MNQNPRATYCQSCGCAECARRKNCPNRAFACEECTPSRPAWQGCVYRQKEKRGRRLP